MTDIRFNYQPGLNPFTITMNFCHPYFFTATDTPLEFLTGFTSIVRRRNGLEEYSLIVPKKKIGNE
ncbi:MAG TPA: hypothetical protein VK568_03195 [Thermodesulfobacteriota bacterium]|nr:hypothetical protein [Thermodesulfobacteriota bacterium]